MINSFLALDIGANVFIDKKALQVHYGFVKMTLILSLHNWRLKINRDQGQHLQFLQYLLVTFSIGNLLHVTQT